MDLMLNHFSGTMSDKADEDKIVQAINDLRDGVRKDLRKFIDRYILFWSIVLVLFAILDISIYLFHI